MFSLSSLSRTSLFVFVFYVTLLSLSGISLPTAESKSLSSVIIKLKIDSESKSPFLIHHLSHSHSPSSSSDISRPIDFDSHKVISLRHSPLSTPQYHSPSHSHSSHSASTSSIGVPFWIPHWPLTREDFAAFGAQIGSMALAKVGEEVCFTVTAEGTPVVEFIAAELCAAAGGKIGQKVGGDYGRWAYDTIMEFNEWKNTALKQQTLEPED